MATGMQRLQYTSANHRAWAAMHAVTGVALLYDLSRTCIRSSSVTECHPGSCIAQHAAVART